MKEWIIRTLKRVFSDVRSAIISLIVVAIVGGTAGLLAVSESALNFFLSVIQIETPFWATASLLILLYLFIKIQFQKSLPPQNDNDHLVSYGDFKWLVSTINGRFWALSETPYCAKHDSKLIITPAGQYICPEVIGGKCDTKILNRSDIPLIRNMAESYIESATNSYKTKH